jgi:hypothetical protein
MKERSSHSMIHTCMRDLRLGFERDIQMIEMRAHELTMTMDKRRMT